MSFSVLIDFKIYTSSISVERLFTSVFCLQQALFESSRFYS
jgi:hypothetical protein